MYHTVISIYGVGVEKFETIVSDEMNILMEELERHENQDFQIGKFLARSLKYIICIMVSMPVKVASSLQKNKTH